MATAQLDNLIRQRTEAFVADLTDLVKRAALESVKSVLDGTSAGGSASTGGPAPRRGRPPGSARSASSRPRKKGQKRTPEDLEALTNDLYSQIKRTPGLRIEEIAEALGTKTKELALPARKLIKEKRVKTTGQKRATKYFPKD